MKLLIVLMFLTITYFCKSQDPVTEIVVNSEFGDSDSGSVDDGNGGGEVPDLVNIPPIAEIVLDRKFVV